MRIEGPSKTTAPFKGEHLGQAQTTWPDPNGWLKIFDRADHSGRVQQKSRA